jgi:4-amino-4-deoxy-L-arabinose transferase-like glycosyltransferase
MLPRFKSMLSPRSALLALLFLTALAASSLELFFVDQPGMMDACYYYSGGLTFVRGQGWNESFLWNYLDESASLPHPGNQYWMPFSSAVAAVGMWLFREGFRQAQLPFLLLAIGFPFLTFHIGKRLTGSFRAALLTGFFAIASGFYVIYWLNTETFLLYAWIGGLFFLWSARMGQARPWTDAFLIGALCGLAHMTRADGVLFLAMAGLLILIDRSLSMPARAGRMLSLGSGYLLISGIWYLRNLMTWGSFFPPGTGKTLWLTQYNDMFRFPSTDVTMERFLSGGLSPILSARWSAIQTNMVTTIFVIGLVFLFPLVCWGIILLRRKTEIRTAVLYFLLIFVLMSLVYPFQGTRGGFLHSATALLSASAAAASAGLEDVINRLVRWRKWNSFSAHAVIGAGIAGLALASSGVIFFNRVIDSVGGPSYWSGMNKAYSIGVSRLGITDDGSIRFIVNNAPCFHVETGFQAVPVPSGDPDMLLAAADRYDVRYVILDGNIPDGLRSLYLGEITNPRLKKVLSFEYQGMEYVWFEVLPAATGTGT